MRAYRYIELEDTKTKNVRLILSWDIYREVNVRPTGAMRAHTFHNSLRYAKKMGIFMI